MNAHRTQPITWHQVDERAHAIAGDNAVVRQVPEVFSRYPGLNIQLIDRLDSRLRGQASFGYTDCTKDHLGKNSPIYGISGNKLLAKIPELFPDHSFENEQEKAESISIVQSHIFNYIDKGRALHMGIRLRPPADVAPPLKTPPVNTKVKNMHSVVFGYSDMATRQEILAGLANIHPQDVTTDIQGSLAESHAFVRNHEFQHGRTAQTWALEPDFFEPMGTAAIEYQKPCYQALKNKAMMVRKMDDPYIEYLNEQISDAAGALHHMKNGGRMGFLQNIADARAIGAVNGAGHAHHTASVLDAIIANEQRTRYDLERLQPEQLDDLAITIVGKTAWTREEFYQNAVAASFGRYVYARDMGLPHEQQVAEFEEAMRRANELSEKYSPDILQQEAMRERAEKRIYALQTRANEGKYRLIFQNRENALPPAERHLVEVNAAVKYNQGLRPELNNPQGAQYLLKVRARQMQEEGRFDAFEQTIVEKLNAREEHEIHLETCRQKAFMRVAEEEKTQLIPGGGMAHGCS